MTKPHCGRWRVRVDGLVRGEVHGVVSGVMHAIVDGEVDLNLISGVAAEEEDENES